ncbi:MAG: hypothetical protein NVS3B10_00390 [Polyangiales bacterium]
MSATGRSVGNGYARDPLDFFETPAWCVRAILPHLPARPWRVLDAGCGTGAIAREAARYWPDAAVVGVEIDPGRASEALVRVGPRLRVLNMDFLRAATLEADLVVMNPPFSLAMEFVQRALGVTPVVAALLRLPWLASQKRAAWLRAHPPSVNVLPKRPSFTGDGRTDATDYAWLTWSNSSPTVRILEAEAGR